MTSPLRKPEGLNWDPAVVELPQIPLLPPGEDAMSATIAAVLPTLATPLAANVAALSAKENMYRGKLGAAEASYQNTDDSGNQSIGQLTGMLGQLGQMAGSAGQSGGGLGGQTGMFGSLMEQVMQAAQGGGGVESAAGQPTGGGGMAGAAGAMSGAGGQQQPVRDANLEAGHDDAAHAEKHEPAPSFATEEGAVETEEGAVDAAAGPDAGGPGPVPVTPPDAANQPGDDEDLARRM